MSRIVLASGSPRRQELLNRIGITDFDIRVPQTDEHYPAGLTPAQIVEYISREKADAAAKLCTPEEIVITAAALVLYALLLPVLTFFPCTLALNIVLCATFARKENEASEEMKGKLSKKQFLGIVIYSVVLTIVLWLLFTQILKCVLP